jgi:predicted esterase
MKILITERQLEFIKNIPISEASVDQLKDIFLDSGRISQTLFDEIVKASHGKGAYATWLIKRIEDGSVMEEDVYKFKGYFPIFNKYKSHFPSADINEYKGNNGVNVFINKVIDIREKDVEQSGGDISNLKNLVNQNGISELKSVGINFVGTVDGYQCFEVPQELMGSEQAYKTYKKHLANCHGRSQGAKIAICTMAHQRLFDKYLKSGPYYVFYNLSDPKSPYQFHYETNQFKDKNDKDLM